MAYRLLAMDLDDTLLDNRLHIREEDRRALLLARRAGVVLTLATGRMYRAALPYARELEIDAPLISYQGAYVKSPRTGEVLLHRPVPLELALEVISRVRARGIHLNIYLDDELYVEKHTPESGRYAAMSRVPVRAVGPLEAFLRRVGRDPTKVLAIAREDEIETLLREMRPLYAGRLHVTRSKLHFLEFSHPLADKGRALAAVAGYYGLRPEEVIAVGDSYNDLEMLEWAGLGVAMANARPEVRARADFITASNEEGGVARVVEKFILGEK